MSGGTLTLMYPTSKESGSVLLLTVTALFFVGISVSFSSFDLVHTDYIWV